MRRRAAPRCGHLHHAADASLLRGRVGAWEPEERVVEVRHRHGGGRPSEQFAIEAHARARIAREKLHPAERSRGDLRDPRAAVAHALDEMKAGTARIRERRESTHLGHFERRHDGPAAELRGVRHGRVDIIDIDVESPVRRNMRGHAIGHAHHAADMGAVGAHPLGVGVPAGHLVARMRLPANHLDIEVASQLGVAGMKFVPADLAERARRQDRCSGGLCHGSPSMLIVRRGACQPWTLHT